MATCRLCSKKTSPSAAICSACNRAYGPKAALFLARAQADSEFANAALCRLQGGARERLFAAVSQRYLASGPGPGLRKASPRHEVPHRKSA